MSENICNCHCGTRIDLDEQLLEERQMWKEKYNCLQKQIKIDIDSMKENIYMECADLMQKQFSAKETQHNQLINDKNHQIKNLISKIIELQTQIKILGKEKEILQQKLNTTQAQHEQKQTQLNTLKTKLTRTNRQWELKHEEDLINTRKHLSNQAKQELDKLQLEKQHLKHKIRQFQLKYNKIIPQVQKIKQQLNHKTSLADQLQETLQKQQKQLNSKIQFLKKQLQDAQKLNKKHQKHSKQQQQQIDQLKSQLEKAKKITKQVRVEPVYIDRPVQVEKIVEKVVEVEKVVKKYIDNPNSQKLQSLQTQNNKLIQELNKLLAQMKQMEETFKTTVHQYEEIVKVHEQNAIHYKKQRQALAQRISQQNQQIQMLQDYTDKAAKKHSSDGEKIVVHVKQDGTYQKTVEKLPKKKK